MNPSRFGLLLTFTASVHAAPGKTVEGLVTFKDGKTVLGTGNVNRSGQATLSTPILSAGLHLISVSYREGQNQAEAASSILRQAIDRAPTVTSIHLPSSSAPGTGITLTASVFTKDPAPTAGPPMGSVIFKDGKTVLGTATINMFQQAVFSAPALSAGLHSLTASYQGNANFAGSTSSTFNLTVTK
ncbi:MAG TPA: Ig-like domain-containing protein [Candidatus Angelobacter sp.]|nr:Ig-like domain-containing protein [Candidatus Angelobacter sp.]